MKLAVGLGNIGDRYADTYHNIGFIALDRLAERFAAPPFRQKDNALISDVTVGGEKLMLAKPTTFMNLSGDAVSKLARYYKLEPKDIVVVYDDIDIHKGTVRARLSGSAGTHNGMRDIVSKLGSTAFPRVRIGTGIKPSFIDLVDYVLMHITSVEKPKLVGACDIACDYVEAWARGEPWQELTRVVE